MKMTSSAPRRVSVIGAGFTGNPNEPSAVRGGPMFEFLFGIDEQLKREGGEFKADLILFMPGMTGNLWFDQTDLARSPGGLLKAAAAATNLLTGLQGQAPSATFKVELICIIDALVEGTLVWRTPKRNIILSSSRVFHWAKRGFERLHLRRYQ